jgi:hypothetical protein
VKLVDRDLARGCQQPYRQRQVERTASFRNVCGGKVYSDSPGGQPKADIRQRRDHALLSFPHRTLRQPHHMEHRHAAAEIDLDTDLICVHSEDRTTDDLCKHGSLHC